MATMHTDTSETTATTELRDTTEPAGSGNAAADHNRWGDLAAIEQVVATIEHSQQNELPDEFVSLFREDAIWTTGGGRLLWGRTAISDFTHQVLPGAMADGSVTYDVVDVLFIRPDVAAVKVRGQYRTLDGTPMGNPTTPMYVMAKEGGRWLLVASQNTEELPVPS